MLTKQVLDRYLEPLGGEISFVAMDTITGEKTSYNESFPVEAASVIKLYIMLEAFRQDRAGIRSLNDMITVTDQDRLPSCGALTYLTLPLTLPVRDLVTLMIIVSDNTATNILIDLLGIENIRNTIAAEGFQHTYLRRKLFMPELARQGIINETCAEDCGLFMQRLLEGTLIDAEASAEMLKILRSQRLNGKIPVYLHGRDIASAHKTGEDDGITHDVGILFTEHPVIYCFMSQKVDTAKAEQAIARLAALCCGIPEEEL